jgi:hypothetical protein
MPTHREDLSRLSLADLERLTGLDRRTLRKRLAGLEPAGGDGRTLLFDSRTALARVYLGDSLDLTRERARLAAAQAEAQERENAVERGELVDAAEVETWLLRLLSAVVQRLRALPSKAAPDAHAAVSIAESEARIRLHLDAALEELASAEWIAPSRRRAPAPAPRAPAPSA